MDVDVDLLKILSDINASLSDIKVHTEQIGSLRARFEAHETEDDKRFNGNGKEGLIVKVDRLEQRAKRHAWLMGIGATLVAGLFSWLK